MNTLSTFFKKTPVIVVLLLCMSVIDRASAQECQISLSRSSVDYGQIKRPSSNSAPASQDTLALDNRTITLNASCPSAAKIMLRLTGDAASGEQFKFSKDGQVSVTLSNALLDGRNVELAHVKYVGAPAGSYSASITASPGDVIIPIVGGVPASGSVFSMQVEIQPSIPMSEFHGNDARTLKSNLSFEVKSY